MNVMLNLYLCKELTLNVENSMIRNAMLNRVNEDEKN